MYDMYVCMYVYIYIYIHTCIHIGTSTNQLPYTLYAYTYTHIYIYPSSICVCVCVSAIKQARKGVKATRCTYAKSRTIFALHVPNKHTQRPYSESHKKADSNRSKTKIRTIKCCHSQVVCVCVGVACLH